MPQWIFMAVAGVVCLFILVVLVRSGRFFRSLIFSAVTGNMTLYCVSYLGAFTGVLLLPNWFTLTVATLLGVPGVLAMLIGRLIFRI